MSLKPGDYRYAVAIRDGSGLWLTLWVRRKSNGEFLVFWPRPAQRLKFSRKAWNPHTSYHLDGNLHSKSYDQKVLKPEKHQALTGSFRGTVHLGLFGGHGTGIPCDQAKFSAVIPVPPGLLGAHEGMVSVDLVQPGVDPIIPICSARMVQQVVIQDFEPWVVIRIWSTTSPNATSASSVGSTQ